MVDSSGGAPATSATAAEMTSVKAPGSVRKASPLMVGLTMTLPWKPSPAARASCAIQSARPWPLWFGLKRMFSRALATAGIRLVVGLPTSTVVISRFEGWKPR